MIIAAVVSVLAAVVSVLGSVLTARSQHKSKLDELEQIQLKDILAKRLEAYPQLWAILQAQVSDWRMEGKRANGKWALKLHADLNACHAQYGVFFSQPVYEAFCEVRAEILKLAATYGPDQVIPAEKIEELDSIWSAGGIKAGLAMQLKDDLGNFRPSIISLRKIE